MCDEHKEHELMIAVRELVRGTLQNWELKDHDDLFDAGATSLTVVDLQLRIEERLSRSAPTHLLMTSPTIAGWVAIYAHVEAEANASAKSAASEVYSPIDAE